MQYHTIVSKNALLAGNTYEDFYADIKLRRQRGLSGRYNEIRRRQSGRWLFRPPRRCGPPAFVRASLFRILAEADAFGRLAFDYARTTRRLPFQRHAPLAAEARLYRLESFFSLPFDAPRLRQYEERRQ